jgi:hypothetical protein
MKNALLAGGAAECGVRVDFRHDGVSPLFSLSENNRKTAAKRQRKRHKNRLMGRVAVLNG